MLLKRGNWIYLAKVLPDPLLTTSETGTPSSEAMNPSTEKMANPAKTDVKQLPKQTISVSLETSRSSSRTAFVVLCQPYRKR